MKRAWTVGSQAEFAASFERTSYRFKYFDLTLESGGDPIDVMFNYKDLAHLKVVHNTFDIFYSHIGDDVQSCVVMQKLFGMNFPLTHLALEVGENRLFFHELVPVRPADKRSDDRAAGGPSRTDEDDLRHRRTEDPAAAGLPDPQAPAHAQLSHPDEGRCPHARPARRVAPLGRTAAQDQLLLPRDPGFARSKCASRRSRNGACSCSIALSTLAPNMPTMVGRSDHYGLQLWRRDEAIEIFPRMCPHEGACLDQKTLKADKSISCPWHGRRLGPILRIDLPARPAEFATAFHRYTVSGDELRITPLSQTEATAKADWTQPAATASLR